MVIVHQNGKREECDIVQIGVCLCAHFVGDQVKDKINWMETWRPWSRKVTRAWYWFNYPERRR